MKPSVQPVSTATTDSVSSPFLLQKSLTLLFRSPFPFTWRKAFTRSPIVLLASPGTYELWSDRTSSSPLGNRSSSMPSGFPLVFLPVSWQGDRPEKAKDGLTFSTEGLNHQGPVRANCSPAGRLQALRGLQGCSNTSQPFVVVIWSCCWTWILDPILFSVLLLLAEVSESKSQQKGQRILLDSTGVASWPQKSNRFSLHASVEKKHSDLLLHHFTKTQYMFDPHWSPYTLTTLPLYHTVDKVDQYSAEALDVHQMLLQQKIQPCTPLIYDQQQQRQTKLRVRRYRTATSE